MKNLPNGPVIATLAPIVPSLVCRPFVGAFAFALSTFPVLAVTDARVVISSETLEVSGRDVAIRKQLLGFNGMFWVDTDRMLRSDEKLNTDSLPIVESYYTKLARELGVGLLRYPGGTASQNYNWITNRPVAEATKNNGRWPQPRNLNLVQSAEKGSGGKTDHLTDFYEFTDWARAIGADTAVAVNLEGMYHASDAPLVGLERFNAVPTIRCETDANGVPRDAKACYLKLAVEWVHEANIEHGGTNRIEYWDLGNESYGFTRWPYGATEYAKDACIFHDAMKAVDPTIKIGIIGPPGYQDSGAFDGLSECAQLEYRNLRQVEARQRFKHGKRTFTEKMNASSTPASAGKACSIVAPAVKPWWPTVLNIARGCFDYVVVHKFDLSRSRHGKTDLTRPYRHREEWLKISDAARKVNPDAELSVNAWSLGHGKRVSYSEDEFILSGLDFFEEIVNAGATSAALWPWAHNGIQYGVLRLLFDKTANVHSPVLRRTKQVAGYDLYRLLVELRDGVLLRSRSDNPYVSMIAVRKGNEIVALLRNRRREPVTAVVENDTAVGGTRFSASAWDARANKFVPRDAHDAGRQSVRVEVPAAGVLLLRSR